MSINFEIVEESIEIPAAPSVVFERWTRFEEFPRFMEGVTEVHRKGQRRLCWQGEFGGEMRGWESDITVWIPGHRIAWRSTFAGERSSRAVCVEEAGANRTRLTLEILIDPDEASAQMPTIRDISHRLRRHLIRFKELLESEVREATSGTD